MPNLVVNIKVMHQLPPFCFGFSLLRIDSLSLDGISDQINLRGAYSRHGKLTPWHCRMSFRVLNELFMQHLPNDQRLRLCEAIADILIAGQAKWEEIILRRCLGRDLVLEHIVFLSEFGQEKSQANPLIGKVSRLRKK